MTAAAASLPLRHAVSEEGLLFRVARVFLLCLIIVLPMEAITAAREIAMAGAAVFLAAHLLLVGPRRFRPTVLLLPLALYAACAALSLLSAVDPAYSLGELRAEVGKGLIIYYTGVHFVGDEAHLRQCWSALLWATGIMAVAGIVFFAYHGGSLVGHQVRAGSLHSGYGTFGTFLVTVWPFVLLMPRAFPSRRLVRLWPALAAVTLASAYVTYNRAAWAGMLVQVGLWLVVLAKRRLRWSLIGGALCLAVLGALLLAPGTRHGEHWKRLWAQPEKVGGTAGDLASLWQFSFRHLAKSPFVGIGLGRHSFSKAFPDFRHTHQPLLWHAHNMFIQLALETGVQGMAAILLIMTLLVVCLWPHAPPAPGDLPRLFGAATVLMVVGFAVRNLTDDFFVDDSALLFWLIAGLAMGGRYLLGRQDS